MLGCRKKQQEMLESEQSKVEEMEKGVHEQEVQVKKGRRVELHARP